MRTALDYVEAELGTRHVLASGRFLTDGVDIFWHLQERGSAEDLDIVNLSQGGQKVFPQAVMRYLRKVEWGSDQFAARWWPDGRGRDVVVDPTLAFGAPAIAGTGIRTEDIYQRFDAGESLVDLAGDYGLTVGQVEAAIRAEARFLERLAA